MEAFSPSKWCNGGDIEVTDVNFESFLSLNDATKSVILTPQEDDEFGTYTQAYIQYSKGDLRLQTNI